MKAIIKSFILFIILNSVSWIAPEKASAQGSVSFQVFYDELSPYGTWVENPDYGYVWVPTVSSGFTPYGTNGYWVFTDEGWTWVSDYPWGWAPFHYGRWYFDPIYGSMWVPDYEWGPGWVTWRRSEGYYGWAPIEPGVSISLAYSDGYRIPHERWMFVRDQDFGRRNINNYYVNRSNNTTIINKSTVINNVRVDNLRNVKYNAGPDKSEVQQHVSTPIIPVAIKERTKPGQNLSNNQLEIYRPLVEKNNAGGRKPMPSKVTSLNDVKPASQRNAQTEPQPSSQQRNGQSAQPQPSHQQRNGQPAQQQPSHEQRNGQPVQQQPSHEQRNGQPVQQQPSHEQRNGQPARQQPLQPQRNGRPTQDQQPRTGQPNPPQKTGGENQPQQKNQPNKEQQPQHSGGSNNHQPSQPQQPVPSQNKDGEKKPK